MLDKWIHFLDIYMYPMNRLIIHSWACFSSKLWLILCPKQPGIRFWFLIFCPFCILCHWDCWFFYLDLPRILHFVCYPPGLPSLYQHLLLNTFRALCTECPVDHRATLTDSILALPSLPLSPSQTIVHTAGFYFPKTLPGFHLFTEPSPHAKSFLCSFIQHVFIPLSWQVFP